MKGGAAAPSSSSTSTAAAASSVVGGTADPDLDEFDRQVRTGFKQVVTFRVLIIFVGF